MNCEPETHEDVWQEAASIPHFRLLKLNRRSTPLQLTCFTKEGPGNHFHRPVQHSRQVSCSCSAPVTYKLACQPYLPEKQ